MKRIFITGGTGFFGKALLRYFNSNHIDQDFEITLLTRNKSRFLSTCPKSISLDHIRLIEGDILFPSDFPECNFDYVIHAATDSTHGLKIGPLNRSQQIIDGTRNILEWCKNSKIRNFLFVSSGGVYGKINKPISENSYSKLDQTNIHNTYSVSKYFSEHLCYLYHHAYNLPFSIIRCFSFVGIDLPMNEHFAIGNFILNVMNESDIKINGDGSPVRSYMDQRDLAHWLFYILLNGKEGEVYNVGSNEEITIAELANLLKEISCSKSNVLIRNKEIVGQSKDRNYYVPDITKARKELGLELSFSLRDSILHVISEQKR